VLTDRATPLATLGGLWAGVALLLACVPCARAAQPSAGAGAPGASAPASTRRAQTDSSAGSRGLSVDPSVSAEVLSDYIASVARAWVPYTTADGRVEDPLNPGDTGDNYGVILLADTMLRVARQTDDSALESAGVRIVDSAITLPVPSDPFNLLAIAATIHDGRAGEFPARAWAQIATPLALLAGQIGPPTAASCLTELGCYSNWRLVWAAGAALLRSDEVSGEPGTLAGEGASVATQIKADLSLAISYAGAPLRTIPALDGPARELSDPGAEPPAYELFSTFMLQLIGESDPSAIGPATARLTAAADRYALEQIAPDGQLSLAGRSLDESWVQAAAAALGARRALREPTSAGRWRAFAERACSYLMSAYPLQANGLLPIVPGLDFDFSPSIVDGYAALNQYEGLTLWLLSDALERWPAASAPQASLPADARRLLADDLASSGLVWGRAGAVWWELSGRSTSGDPREAQGLVAIKVDRAGGWRDLLALRPIQHGKSSVWALGLAQGAIATPTFVRVRGTGASAVFSGGYRRPNGRLLARARWTLSTTATGVRVSMSVPARATLHTTVWLTSTGPRLSAPGASRVAGACTVTASGRACPVTISWPATRDAHFATLEIES
jgi:hypothetical protein